MIPQYIFLRPNKTFNGVYTDGEALPGETKTLLTDQQFSDFNALARPDPAGQNRLLFFDAAQSPAFFWPTCDQCVDCCPTVQSAIRMCMLTLPTDVLFVQLIERFGILESMFTLYGPNGGVAKAKIQAYITSLNVGANVTLLALKARILALQQWSL